MNGFSEYIEQFKAGIGLTDEEIAEIMGVGQVTLENYISGYVPPSKQAAERITAVLGIEDRSWSGPSVEGTDTAKVKAGLCARDRFGVLVEGDALAEHKIYGGSYGIIQGGIIPKDGDILYVSVDGGEGALKVFAAADGQARLYDGSDEIIIPLAEFEARVLVAGKLVGTAEKLDQDKFF